MVPGAIVGLGFYIMVFMALISLLTGQGDQVSD